MEGIDLITAIALQQELRQRIVPAGDISGADLIGGADTSSESGKRKEESGGRSEYIFASIVVWSISQQKIIDSATASLPVTFPYIPGLLAFREVPSLIEAWAKLRVKPDVVICDGHGIAHPRRCGIACHLGVELCLPSIGCGKSKLVGWFEEPGDEKCNWSDLWERDPGKSIIQIPNSKIGRVVRTRRGVAPVFVSVGHLCGIEEAVDLILRCTTRYRLPEPIRAAHQAAGIARRSDLSNNREVY